MLPMHKKEFEKWTEVRKDGNNKYAFKTSLTATILVFLMYFVTNGYLHLADINKYLEYNLGSNADTIFISLALTFIALFFVSKILFAINEKRYAATENKSQGTD